MSRKKENKSIYLLLVEDSQRYLDELYEWFFNIYEYKNIEVAKSEKQAKEKLDQLFDVIIADMRMESNESGFAIVDEVKKRNLSSVVIILTANETVADCREAFKKEAWDYISKGMKGNVFEEVHKSIQQAVEYFNQWGNKQDRKWIDDNFEELLDKYSEQYIAVLNNRVIGNHDSKEELEKELHLKKLPTFLTILERVSISEQNVIKQLKTEIEQAQKPVIYVEGKTDKLILECAWQKLYGNRSQPFFN